MENKIVKGKNIYEKLSKVQSHSKELLKDARNEYQSYNYFTEYQALKLLKPLMDEQGLAMTFEDIYEGPEIPVESRLNKLEKVDKEWIIQYWKKVTLVDVDKPESKVEMRYWCIGTNNHISKAKGSAETYGMKYFLTKFFMMPTTENEDPDKTKDSQVSNKPLTEDEKKKVNEFLTKHGLDNDNDKTTGQTERKASTLRCNICKSILLYRPENKRYWCSKCDKETETRESHGRSSG